MKATRYDQKGVKTGDITLPESVFGLPWNAPLVHQVVVAMQANARTPVAHTKTRAEVSGGGRKPWRQKGTGRARHGSNRSPIWVGGGVTFGPRNDTIYSKKINKKMRTKALFVALSKKLADGKLLFVDSLSFNEPKSVQAKDYLGNFVKIKGFEDISARRNNSALILMSTPDLNLKKSFGNFGNVQVGLLDSTNVRDVLAYRHVVILAPEEAIKQLEAKLAPERAVEAVTA